MFPYATMPIQVIRRQGHVTVLMTFQFNAKYTKILQ